jgi:glycosyltransferase involved in cell wall biosynthesis
MNGDATQELRFSIDRLETRGKRIFGWGWIAYPSRAIRDVALDLEGRGWERRLPANFGLTRDDVETAFPDLVHSKFCGFVVTGYSERQPIQRVALAVTFEDGANAKIDVTGTLAREGAGRRKWQELRWLALAVWRRLRHGDLRGIVSRVKTQNYVAPSLDDATISAMLLPHLRIDRPVVFVFDHNMGGGANAFRRTTIDERVAAGATVLLCTYNLPTLDYRLTLFAPGESESTYRISSFLVLEPILDQAPVTELFLNSPVSFDEPLLFAEWLARMRAEHRKLRLTVTAHDYFAACPSFVLLNADGRYCGIPDVSVCASCLERHRASYVTLSPPTRIGPWRASWRRCLVAADEVRCFSNSTRRLLMRAFPDLDVARVTVVPHQVDYRPARLPRLHHAAPLTIGIAGHISVQKGAEVVKEILTLIERDRPQVRVVVIGTLDLPRKSNRLLVTGPYRRDDLPDLIEANGINMFLFPSICPETFSYVIEELMLLRMPLVAFDIGAPGDRLRGCDHARLCGTIDAAAALATMVEFHDRLAADEAIHARGGPLPTSASALPALRHD